MFSNTHLKALPFLLGLMVLLPAASLPAQSSPSAEAEAWQNLLKASQPLSPPPSWNKTAPTQKQIDKFNRRSGANAYQAAELARAFYTRFPKSSHAAEAHQKEASLLKAAFGLGNQEAGQRLIALSKEGSGRTGLTEDERFALRLHALQVEFLKHRSEGTKAMFAALAKGARQLQKDFPKQPETYQLLLMVAMNSDARKAQAMASQIVHSKGPVPDAVMASAQGLLNRLEALGKPLQLKFQSLNGRTVDVQQMKGKVVLVDFWATWCGPCRAELPDVKAAYRKLHSKGFDIVGISLDQQKDALQKFVKSREMPWPQYFDGKGWDNKIAKRFGIQSIPTMWLVDKKGVLRSINAREDLAGQVQKLLAKDQGAAPDASPSSP